MPGERVTIRSRSRGLLYRGIRAAAVLTLVLVTWFGAEAAQGRGILVEGDLSVFNLLTSTHLLEGSAAIFFSKQQTEGGIALLAKVDHVIFTSGEEGLILDLVRESFRVPLDGKGGGEFVASSSGPYDVWLPVNERAARRVWISGGARVEVDDKVLALPRGRRAWGRRWLRAGEVALKAGSHRIVIDGRGPAIEEVVVLPKGELDARKTWLDQHIGRSPMRVTYLVSLRSPGPSPEAGREKGRRSHRFRIPKSDEFELRGVFENARFTPGGLHTVGPILQPEETRVFRAADLEKMDIELINCEATKACGDKGVTVAATFDGDQRERELVRLRYDLTGQEINPNEKPFLTLTYALEDHEIQSVQLILWFERKDAKATPRPVVVPVNKGYPTGDQGLATFRFNLLQKVNEIFGKTKKHEVRLNAIELLLRKREERDCSGELKGTYVFSIASVGFAPCDFPEVEGMRPTEEYVEHIGEYCLQSNGEADCFRSLVEVPLNVDVVYRPIVSDSIDLKDNPQLQFRVMDWGTVTPRRYRVTYLVDFDDDGEADGRLEEEAVAVKEREGSHQVPSAFTIVSENLFQRAVERYPRRDRYRLIGLEIHGAEGQERPRRYKAFTMKLQELKRAPIERLEILPDLALDGRTLKGVHQGAYDPEARVHQGTLELGLGKVRLSAGEHRLEVLGSKELTGDAIALISTGARLREGESAQTEFKKINPTRYLVSVREARDSFWLVFSESYNEGWRAYIRLVPDPSARVPAREPWSALVSAWKDRGRRVEIGDHYLVNGYANAWWVDVKRLMEERPEFIRGQDRGSEFEIVLEFKPQRVYEVGIIISSATLITCLGYFLFDVLRRISSRRPRHEA
jgi:hypothetical protein